jgi:hypothetical protein
MGDNLPPAYIWFYDTWQPHPNGYSMLSTSRNSMALSKGLDVEAGRKNIKMADSEQELTLVHLYLSL